ncbi:hypothetical protein [Aquamicrobium zhengzhouense]|uniref:hypothetical protein n=1 Tax=Aquamicrobium zhengzhouense TaxID=2781738 RepID=UPI001AEDC2A4|nr:hypothetical protein [Aquamicrobium zhengzhouense]
MRCLENGTPGLQVQVIRHCRPEAPPLLPENGPLPMPSLGASAVYGSVTTMSAFEVANW